MRKILLSIIFAVVLFAGCSTKSETDIEAIRQSLMEVDREFSNLSVEQGMLTAFDSFMGGDSAVMYRSRQDPIRGRDDILALYPNPEDQQGTLSWEPFFADAGQSADLGYTLGRWSYSAPDSLGNETEVAFGYYVTIWKKQSDGTWKYVFDSGVSGQSEEDEPNDEEQE